MTLKLPATVFLLGWVLCVSMAAWATPLNSTRAVNALSAQEAEAGQPVDLDAIITHACPDHRGFFIQADHSALYMEAAEPQPFAAGDLVHVHGSTRAGFHPEVLATSLQLKGHGLLPEPVPTTFGELIGGAHYGELVRLRAAIHSAASSSSPNAGMQVVTLRLMAIGGSFDAMVNNSDLSTLDGMLDSLVEVVGIAGARHDSKMHQSGILLFVGDAARIHILERPAQPPWSLAPTPMNQVMRTYHVENLSQRVRVHGVVTYSLPGIAVVLQNGNTNLWIRTQSYTPVKVGDEADAIGFPGVRDGVVVLTEGLVRDTGRANPVPTLALDLNQLEKGEHNYELVSVEGEVVSAITGTLQDEYVLSAGDKLFSAIHRHDNAATAEDNMRIPIGSTVRVTGICVPNNGPILGNFALSILLRTPDDLEKVSSPSPINTRTLTLALVVLLFLGMLIGLRSWIFERRMRHQTARMAYSERRRSRILETINGTAPLADIINQVAELVSYNLSGSPCWVEISDGVRLGSKPKGLEGMRIASHIVPARTGQPLGAVYAAFAASAKTSPREDESLAMAAGLLELAVESRRLYTDLVHRSEFDLLTNVQNRFALERTVDQQIRATRHNNALFALIYIDLNDFKLVNDLYGHHIGDLYLQEAARRMKRQLRPGDLLARMGGDEFAVLVPNIRSRSEVSVLVELLEHAFDKPFQAEGCTVDGSASVGFAIFPDDGRSRDSLFSAADAAMYVKKNLRQQGRQFAS